MIKSEFHKKKKMIKVIDTPYSSFMLEKIFERYDNFGEIIEIKKDLGETKLKANNILKISKKNFLQKKKFIITNSTAFNWSNSIISNFYKFRQIQKNILKKISFDKSSIYIGCKTSTIMNMLPKSNRILIDHGFSDYYRRAFKLTVLESILDIIKEKISYYIGYPYISFNEDLKNYTVCKIPNSKNNFIDLQNLPTNKIVNDTFIRIKKKYPRVNTIYLLTKNWEQNLYRGLSNNIDFDHINFNLIKKYAKKGERFFIRYHGFTIQSNQNKSSFIKNLHKFGYYAVDVDNFFKTYYRGLIPAELFISNLKLKRVISKYSSTLHNICHNQSLSCIMDINPELELINKTDSYFKQQLIKEYKLRKKFNKLTRGKVKIIKIN
ncbi:hypothetical protein N9404_04535 [Candidatus Pelagibacter sp.]|nr:hypothetical protein [Candidatus Pelagibacter sp.]